MVTRQLQVRCRSVKVHRSETDVLPLIWLDMSGIAITCQFLIHTLGALVMTLNMLRRLINCCIIIIIIIIIIITTTKQIIDRFDWQPLTLCSFCAVFLLSYCMYTPKDNVVNRHVTISCEMHNTNTQCIGLCEHSARVCNPKTPFVATAGGFCLMEARAHNNNNNNNNNNNLLLTLVTGFMRHRSLLLE